MNTALMWLNQLN